MNRGGITAMPQLALSYSHAFAPGGASGAMSAAALFAATGTAVTTAVTPIVPPLPSLLLLNATGGA